MKTTGVSDIPKFGLLVFLGHPTDDHHRGIMANMVLCVIPGQGNSKILNLVKSGSFDSPIFLYIPNDEKTSTGHLI